MRRGATGSGPTATPIEFWQPDRAWLESSTAVRPAAKGRGRMRPRVTSTLGAGLDGPAADTVRGARGGGVAGEGHTAYERRVAGKGHAANERPVAVEGHAAYERGVAGKGDTAYERGVAVQRPAAGEVGTREKPARPPRPGRHRRPRPPSPGWLTLPEPLRGARLTAPMAAVVGLLLVVVVAGVVFGVRVAMARAAGAPQPVAPTVTGAAVVKGSSFGSSTSGGAGGGGPPATTAGTVTVHVVGQVAHPGVVRLPVGARVADAVAKAGGARKGADLGAINLARVLVDGEQVRVPKPGEAVSAGGTGAGGGGATGAGGAGSPGGGPGGRLDLNTATQPQLEELPGVGPVLAQRILDWRTEHGRFTSVDELGEVSGIGEKIFAQLQPKVTV